MACLVLDAMGVIYQSADDVAELLVPFLGEHSGTTTEAQIQAAYHAASLGEISADDFWYQVGVAPGLEDAYLERHRLNPGLMKLLVQAQGAGIPVCCLSNDVGRWSQKLRTNLGVEPYLEHSVISSDVGLRKPDPRIYQIFIDTSGYRAEELLFVDDRAKNVDAARALGIECHLFEAQPGFTAVRDWISNQAD